MPDKPRILVTGMSGLIGTLAGQHLSERFTIRALNRRSVPGIETVQADIGDLEAILPAFEDVDTVIHLAAYLGSDDASQLHTNVMGTYNVFEAARRSGVRRVVFASSGAVMGGYHREEPFKSFMEGLPVNATAGGQERPLVTHMDPVRPTTLYGAAKVWGEALGRYYSEAHGFNVICLRFGRVIESNEPEDPIRASIHLSHRDAVQIIVKSVEAVQHTRFEVFYVVSDNVNRIRDIEHARQVTGFVPQDGITELPRP